MSPQLLAMVLAPLLGLFIISIGNGFLSSLTTLRLDAAGTSPLMVGLISSAYFFGLTLGALFGDRVIVRTGHIRAYSSFASLTAVTAMAQALTTDPWIWLFLRLINGWAIVGVFLVVESWLLLAGDQKMRGRLLALYMIALYGAGMLGQMGLGMVDSWGPVEPFIVAGMLASLSVLPMAMIPRTAPLVEKVEALSPRRLFADAPAGVAGCFGSGIAIGAVYTLLPLYLQRIGLDVQNVGLMMASVILGAMVLQYPVGRWSDMQDRRVVMIALGLLSVVLSAAIILLPPASSLLIVLLFLLGGCIFAMYPVAVSHAADNASHDALVPMIQGLLLINSFGSAMSPLAISSVMTEFGEAGLFWSFGILNAVLVVFLIWRRRQKVVPAPAVPIAPAPILSPIRAEFRVTEEMVQGAIENDEAEQNAVEQNAERAT
ncbi:MFS family permease [Neorhizobium huautlense]|uniref:MFS family permease n=1 Tax=Neorhizobium huautlense TaxID=67774 RepID=A0ABT9PX36_9HYPH|nr:MFS transporter [Neorhizobium huautlense]MDP9839027.1 MFS family permease [Neorhizobium huautlense]